MRSDGAADVRYRACPSTHAVDLDDEVLIWDARVEQLHRLNPSAARIWHVLSSWRTTAQVTAALTAETDADASRLERDVAQCVAGFVRAGLLEQQGAG
jgi:Coenzyme PQQ synthesis protein D (PqqD)